MTNDAQPFRVRMGVRKTLWEDFVSLPSHADAEIILIMLGSMELQLVTEKSIV